MLGFVVDDFQEVDICVLDWHLRKHKLVAGHLLEVDQLNTSAIPNNDEGLFESRSWNH